jgi:hypothetical protein
VQRILFFWALTLQHSLISKQEIERASWGVMPVIRLELGIYLRRTELKLEFLKQSEKKKILQSVITSRAESNYQAKLVKNFERDGWEVIKLLKTNKNGYPDLLLLKPNEVRFVEVKALKGRLSKIQEYRIKDLRSKGFPVEVARSPD